MRNIFILLFFITTWANAQTTFKPTSLIIGKGTDVNMEYLVDRAGANNPGMRWDGTSLKWFFSNDGISFGEMVDKNYVDTAVAGASIPDATTMIKGKIQLAGDLAGTAAAPTVPALVGLTTDVNDALGRLDIIEPEVADLDSRLGTVETEIPNIQSDITDLQTDKANIASPTFTGVPAAPTATGGTNTTQIATTAFVTSAVAASTAPDATTGSKGIVQLAGDLAGTATAPTVPGLALKAPLASPALTGTPTAPTATQGNNSTQVATTAYVDTLGGTKATGPASATDNAVTRFDGTTGKLVQNSGVIIDDSNNVSGALSLDVGNTTITGSTISSKSGNNLILTNAGSDQVQIQRPLRMTNVVAANFSSDSASGSSVTLTTPVTKNIRLTSAGTLVSIAMIPAGLQGQEINLSNQTGVGVTILNETGGTAANRIYTGTGGSIQLRNNATLPLVYDTSTQRWLVAAGVGGNGLIGSTEVMFAQDFESAALTDFTQTGFSLDTTTPLHSLVSGKTTHATSVTTNSIKQSIAVNEKFRGKNMTFRISLKSNATSGNVLFDAGCTTDTDVINGQTLTLISTTGGTVAYASGDVPATCTTLSYTVRALPEASAPVTIVDDISGYITNYAVQTALVSIPDSYILVSGANGYGSTATTTRRFSTIVKSLGTDITYTDSATNGGIFTANVSGVYSMSCSESSTANVTSSVTLIWLNDTAQAVGYGQQQYNTANANAKYINTTWTGYMDATDTLRVKVETAANNNGQGIVCSMTKEGSLKQVTSNSNQKITIPSSELRFEGSSARGSTATAIAKFDSIAKLRGDAFTIVNTVADGTYVQMKKAGTLTTSFSFYKSGGNQYAYITKNQTVLTATPSAIASEVMGAVGATAASNLTNTASWTGTVAVGDIFRISSSNGSSVDISNIWSLYFQEPEVQVSVSNTVPQFTEADNSLRAYDGNGFGSTNTYIRKFSQASVQYGSDISYASSSTLGDSFTILKDGNYNISYTDAYNVGNTLGITKNASGTTALSSIPLANILGAATTSAAAVLGTASFTGFLAAGDVIRPHANAANSVNANEDFASFSISKAGKPNVTGVNVSPFVTTNVSNDSDWTSCGLLVADIASFGTTATVTQDRCRRDGGDLLVDVRILAGGTIPGTEARLPLKLNGVALTTVSTISALSGAHGNAQDTGNLAGSITPLKEPSVNYMTFGLSTSGTAGLSKVVANTLIGAGRSFAIQGRFPINGWTVSSTNVISPVQTFSTDTAALTFQPAASYTISTLPSAPVGSFITSLYAVSSNAETQCTTAPTQTTADMAINGIRTYSRPYNAASTCNNPTRIAINIGKGLKGVAIDGYGSAAKVLGVDLDYDVVSSTIAVGPNVKSYNESTGILVMDWGFNQLSTNSTRVWGNSSTNTFPTDGYVVINASKTPALAGMSIGAVSGIYKGSTTTISASLATLVWTTADYDTNNAMNAGVYTCPETGTYQINFNARITGTIALNTVLNAQLQKNGTLVREFYTNAGGAMFGQNAQINELIRCNKGDGLRIQLASGATTPVLDNTNNRTFFSVIKVSP